MTNVLMLESALFHFRAVAASVEDEMFASQLRLTLSVLSNAVEAAKDGVNAALVSDIEFALNDVVAVVDELPAADAERLGPPLEMLRNDVAALKEATSIAPETVRLLKVFQSKLKERRTAIERQTYVEGGATAPLPHPPAELRAEALPLRDELAAAGFATPALDVLIDAPDELRFHSINAIIDELDVIAG